MLVHVCCAVDSHYFLQKLSEDYPDEKLVAFFYDPNIHPYSEYRLRLLEVERSCRLLNIDLIEGEYDYDTWLDMARGMEREPEKGRRCSACFDMRFEVSASKASELGEKSFTSTLLTSPKKSIEQLRASGESIAKRYGIAFISPDYRKASGTQELNIEAKKAKLYRQNYCGCLFGLGMQREEMGRDTEELFSHIGGQTMPGSIEERMELFEKRVAIEESGGSYEIVKERFLNWRVLNSHIRTSDGDIDSHILPYSVIRKKYSRGKIEKNASGIYYFGRDEIRFIPLHEYNRLGECDYDCVLSLFHSPPTFEKELEIRSRIVHSPYDLSAIFVVDEIPTKKMEITLDSYCFEDVRDRLIVTSGETV